MMERNVNIPGANGFEGRNTATRTVDSSPRVNEGGAGVRQNSPRGHTAAQQKTASRSSLASSRVASPIGRGSEEKVNLSGSTGAINTTAKNENRVHFDLKNSDAGKNQGGLSTTRKSLASSASTVRRLTTQQNQLSALPLDARQRLEEMVRNFNINLGRLLMHKKAF